MAHRIPQPQDVAIDVDRARNPNVLAERPGDPFGNRRLAVAGEPEQEHTATAGNGRPQLVQHLGIDQQILEGVEQVVAFRILTLDRLPLDAGDVILQWDRTGSVVSAVLVVIAGDLATRFGQDVDVVVGGSRTLVGDVLLHLQPGQQRLDHAERQLDLIGNFAAFRFADVGQEAIHDRFQNGFVDTRGNTSSGSSGRQGSSRVGVNP